MKKSIHLVLMLLAISFSITSCTDDEDLKATVVLETDFDQGANGWKAVFAEYPKDDSVFYELEAGIRPLPAPLDEGKKSFMLSGNNHSDALRMFLVKQVSGLEPSTSYRVQTEVELASMYPDGSVGAGGSPANSVFLVARFATLGYTLKEGEGRYDNIELTLNQDESIPESVLEMDLGDVAIASGDFVYQLISRQKASAPEVVRSDSQGRLWAIVGTWSGFEGISTLYYTQIKISFAKN